MTHLSLTIKEGIAHVSLDSADSKVNVLNEAFMAELEEMAGRLDTDPDIRGVVVRSQKKGGFIAGADLHQIASVDDPELGYQLARKGQTCFDRWAALKVPVVAAVHGHCMGGGTEFILACDGRVATEDVNIALPEVKLGLLPGWGGTQRLPRLLSLESALDMILTGKSIRGAKTARIGLVDRVVATDELDAAALTLLQDLTRNPNGVHQRRIAAQGSGLLRFVKGLSFVQTFMLNTAQKSVLSKTGGHYPAPLRALSTIRETLGKPMDQGLEKEARQLGYLLTTSVCKNLVHTFFLSERSKKPVEGQPKVAPLETGAVLGAGVMGAGIAQWMAEKGFKVLLKDIKQEAVDLGMDKVKEIFTSRLKKRKQMDRLDQMMAQVSGTISYDQFKTADIVIEAVAEKMEIKQIVLKEIEPVLSEDAIFATNTSALSVSTLQSVAARPGQVGGLHFFNPVHRMPLVEVIRGDQTSDQTVAALFQAARQLGKIPIEVLDRPGFLVNRLLGTYLLEACLLTADGVRWQSIDKLASEFGWPMGPFRLIDEIGLDIIAEVGTTLTSQLPYLKTIDLLDRAAERGLLGKKGGSGFYLYGDKEPLEDPEIEDILELPQERDATPNDLKRMLYLMVNEAGRCMDEKVIQSAEDLDTGTLFGIGFPPFRGGLARWADGETFEAIRTALNDLEIEGERFALCDTLKTQNRFYGQ